MAKNTSQDLQRMKRNHRSSWFTVAAWGFGIAALIPLALIAGVCLVAPVDWHTRLIAISILIGLCVLLTIGSGWCFRMRDKLEE